jgi:hypothetical protein
MRFEPVMFSNKPLWVLNQVKVIQANHGGPSSCDSDTALAIACTSYGLYQILGANIYANGFKGTIFEYVASAVIQETAFNAFIAAHGFSANEPMDGWSQSEYQDFASFYNGPGNIQAYVQAMMRAVAE